MDRKLQTHPTMMHLGHREKLHGLSKSQVCQDTNVRLPNSRSEKGKIDHCIAHERNHKKSLHL